MLIDPRELRDNLGRLEEIEKSSLRFVVHPEYAVKQALFVDSKAEKLSGQGTATLQTSQFSMVVHQVRAGQEIEVSGDLPSVLRVRDEEYITTTIFVKYNYDEENGNNVLKTVTVVAVPNGLLQEKYNPDAKNTIWLAGRNSPQRREAFRVRLSFARLKDKASWRVQDIPMPPQNFHWCD
jgi:hypothetical protein